MTGIGPDLNIRPLRPAEFHDVVSLCEAEGWDPGEKEVACYHHTDPDGLLLAELRGEPAGCVSAVRYGDDFGFLGLFIVRQDLRGRGYGSRLWSAALDHLDGLCVGLDAVQEEVERYERSGFRAAYETVRFSWMAGGPRAERDEGLEIHAAASVSAAELLAYDRGCFPAERSRFLQCWTGMPGAVTLAACSNGHLRGYGTIRPTRDGYKIAPLFADDAGIAGRLLRALVAAVPPGPTVFVDVPEGNPAGRGLVRESAMREMFRTVRMYRGGVPAAGTGKVFGVTSLELG